MMKLYISIAIGLIVWLLELYAAFTEKARLRRIVKPFCLAFLILIVYFLGYPSPLLLLALAFGLLGDILLLKDDNMIFYSLGGAAFWVNHALFIYLFYRENQHMAPWWILSLLIVAAVVVCCFICKNMIKYMDKMALPCSLYFFILLTEGIFAALLFIGQPSAFTFMIWLGSFSFLISDIVLITGGFVKKIKKMDFYVMLLYVLGQTLMSLGLCLLH